MKNKLIKSFALMLSLITILTTLPVNAYELDSQGMSIESVEYQNSEDDDFVNASEVFAEIGSTYQVTIPKVIVLSGESKSAQYQVSVEGDIAGCETIFVKPDSFVNLFAVNKDMQVGAITQDKTGWTTSTIDAIGNGLIAADNITAGRWTGTFNFEIFLNEVLGDVIAPDHVHNPGEAQVENVVQPTCVLNGTYDSVIYCTDCYTELSRTQEKIPFLGHNFENYVCTRCGINEHEHTCANVLIENEIEPVDGNPGSHEEVYICDICGLEYERKTIYTPIETEFAYTGNIQTYIVPFDGLYELEVWGCAGNGAGGIGGKGGYSKGYIELTRGQKLYVCCGGIAYNGGQNAGYGGSQYPMAASGGATHIALVDGQLASIGYDSFVTQGNGLIVAGGGGGGAMGKNVDPYYYNKGGDGGGLEGERSSATGKYFGTAATQSAGGTGYSGTGSFGLGGYSSYGAGGGGGFYGGASGGYSISGGGGSSYIGGVPEITYNGDTYAPSTTSGINNSNGKAKITFISK